MRKVGDIAGPVTCGNLVSAVRRIAETHVKKVAPLLTGEWDVLSLVSGKMLRTKFAYRVMSHGCAGAFPPPVLRACAAVELVHAASLCHDDVIDNALIRRACPTLWRASSPSGAILVGDILLCEAMGLLADTDGGRYVADFVGRVREVCAAEAEQELRLRGRPVDAPTCLRIARGKTGPLFAFVGSVCGGEDPPLRRALEQAGYALGAAYQLADDLIDCMGDHRAAVKTLGTDRARRKFTLAGEGAKSVRDTIAELCGKALGGLDRWPDAAAGVGRFIEVDLRPLIGREIEVLGSAVRCAR